MQVLWGILNDFYMLVSFKIRRVKLSVIFLLTWNSLKPFINPLNVSVLCNFLNLLDNIGDRVFAKRNIARGEPLLAYRGEDIALEEPELCRKQYAKEGKPEFFIFESKFREMFFW